MDSLNLKIAGHFLLLIGWMVVSTLWYTHRYKKLQLPSPFANTETLFITEPVPNGLTIPGTPVNMKNNIRFYKSDYEPLIPAEVKRAFNHVQSYLGQNNDLVIEVTGAYTDDEKNGSLLSSLGQSRAEAVRAWLIDQGVDRAQVLVVQKEMDSLYFVKDTVMNALTFRVVERGEAEAIGKDSLAVAEKRLHAYEDPFYFYPETINLMVTPEVKQYVWDLRSYLDAHPKENITLTGHTDESSDQDTNFRMARELAAHVRMILIQAGISRQQLNITSRGAEDPVADAKESSKINKNRRVTITFN